MKLLQALESIDVVSKNGILRKRKQGLFYCPVCQEAVIRPMDNGARTETCGRKGCRKTTETKHGYTNTRLYNIWNGVVIRCTKPSSKAYKYYGGKGIGFPKHWETFEGFFADMGISYSDGMTIDRKDSSKDYSKENCQWIPLEKNVSKEKQKAVAKYTLDGVFIKSYPSVQQAVDGEGYKFNSSIAKVARGERNQYRGFVWKYLD